MVAEFDAYSVGICAASVCTRLSDAETTARLNAEHPTGIRSVWEIDPAPTFKCGLPNPGTCELDPRNRHILYRC
jgi:hypothetical protein